MVKLLYCLIIIRSWISGYPSNIVHQFLRR